MDISASVKDATNSLDINGDVIYNAAGREVAVTASSDVEDVRSEHDELIVNPCLANLLQNDPDLTEKQRSDIFRSHRAEMGGQVPDSQALKDAWAEAFLADIVDEQQPVVAKTSLRKKANSFINRKAKEYDKNLRKLRSMDRKLEPGRRNAASKLRHGGEIQFTLLSQMTSPIWEKALAGELKNKKDITEAINADWGKVTDAPAIAGYIVKAFADDGYKLTDHRPIGATPLNGQYFIPSGNIGFKKIHNVLRSLGSSDKRASHIFGGIRSLADTDGTNLCVQLSRTDAAKVVAKRLKWILLERLALPQDTCLVSQVFKKRFNRYLLRQDFRVSMRSSLASPKNYISFYLNLGDCMQFSIDELFAPVGESEFDPEYYLEAGE